MSFLRRGNRRGRRAAALVAAGALMAFQALAIVMAPAASAAVVCTFETGNTVHVETDAGDTVTVSQDTSTGTIKVNGLDCTPVAPVATTTSIVINGDTGDETVLINLFAFNDASETVDWGTVNWTISVGSGTADELDVTAGFSASDPVEVVFGASGIDLNNDGDLDVTHSGFEDFFGLGGSGADLLSAAGSTATGAAFADDIYFDADTDDDVVMGGAGNDTLIGWADDDVISGGLGDDLIDGTSGNDTADFSASATAVNANLATGNATGEGLDTLANIDNLIGSAQGDTLTGNVDDNVITPGAGTDTVNGGDNAVVDIPGGSVGDTVDYSDATAAVTIDLSAGTVTGGDTDTLSGIESVVGSAFADALIGSSGDNDLDAGGGADTVDGGDGQDAMRGGAGIDVADYGLRTESVTVELGVDAAGATAGVCNDAAEFTSGEAGEADCITGVENAILGTGDDVFTGSSFANTVWPNGGQNVLDGDAAGGPATGGDVLDYSVGYESGVEVNMAGGATAGDSAIGFENAIGTAFADTFVGNEASNLIKGGAGNDSIRTGSGDDTAKGGAGNDNLRTGSGDDDLSGAKGNDSLFGGGGDDFGNGGKGKDVCKGVEVRKSCGTAKNPKRVPAAPMVAAKLV